MVDFNVDRFEHQDRGKFLFLKFEDMTNDLNAGLQRNAQRCQIKLSPEQQNKVYLRKRNDFSDFGHTVDMSLREFFQKGELTEYLNYFTPEPRDRGKVWFSGT